MTKPALPIQKTIAIGDLVPMYASEEVNPNKMAPEKFELLVRNIEVNGFLEPIVVRAEKGGKYTILGGHHRYEAAKRIGLPKLLAVVVDLGDKELGATLALNHLHGELDLSAVGDVFREIMIDTGWDPAVLSDVTGFSSEDIAAMLDKTGTFTDGALGDMPAAEVGDAPPAKPFVLEITFSTKEEYMMVKKKLRKAAGKGADLSVGLLNVLGEG